MKGTKILTSNLNPLQLLDNVADRIRLHLHVARSPVMIVEGISDKKVLRNWIPGADIFPASSRDGAVAALRELIATTHTGAICILDEDFARPQLSEIESNRIAYYSGRDLESAFIRSGSLERVLTHFLPQDQDEAHARLIVSRAVEASTPISELRLASYRHSLGFNFDKVGFGAHFSPQTYALDLDGYLGLLCRSRRPVIISPSRVRELLAPLDDELGPRGRDVLKIAASIVTANEKRFRGNLAEMLEAALFATGWIDESLISRIEHISSIEHAV